MLREESWLCDSWGQDLSAGRGRAWGGRPAREPDTDAGALPGCRLATSPRLLPPRPPTRPRAPWRLRAWRAVRGSWSPPPRRSYRRAARPPPRAPPPPWAPLMRAPDWAPGGQVGQSWQAWWGMPMPTNETFCWGPDVCRCMRLCGADRVMTGLTGHAF